MQYEILMDKHENPRKCTILPLKERKDFRIRYFHGSKPIEAFQANVLLHIEGESLETLRGEKISSLALIDCNWKLVAGAMKKLQGALPRLVKIPEGFATAYPRRNKEGKDPDGGLATIEALFIAASFLGIWDESLLDKYHFKENFLSINEEQWRKYSLGKYANQ